MLREERRHLHAGGAVDDEAEVHALAGRHHDEGGVVIRPLQLGYRDQHQRPVEVLRRRDANGAAGEQCDEQFQWKLRASVRPRSSSAASGSDSRSSCSVAEISSTSSRVSSPSSAGWQAMCEQERSCATRKPQSSGLRWNSVCTTSRTCSLIAFMCTSRPYTVSKLPVTGRRRDERLPLVKVHYAPPDKRAVS